MQKEKKAMLEALKKSLGIVTKACEMCGVGRSTHYEWLDNDPEYKLEVQAIQEIAIDFVESALFKQIENGSDRAITFYLETKAKRRGYIKRSEITGAEGKPLTMPIPDFSRFSKEEIIELLKEHDAQK